MAFLKKESQADPTRRALTGLLLLGAGATLAGGAPAAWNFFKRLMEEPEAKAEQPGLGSAKSKRRTRDTGFEKFRDMFEKGPMSYEDAVAYIKQKTSITYIERHNFKIPDPLCLTTAKAFYLFQVVSFPAQKELEKQLGFSQMNVSVTNGVVYKTHNYGNDGRIRALADYILTKQRPRTAVEASSALANWVCDNVQLDLKNTMASPIHTPSKDGGTSEEWRISRGIGISNSFSSGAEVLMNGGVCYDFSNILTDLQNSMGIPSRTVHLIIHSIARIGGTPVFSPYGHSLVQTSFGNGVYHYCDPMPAFDPTRGMIYDTFAYASLEHLTTAHMKRQAVEVYYFGITGAITPDQMPGDLRGTLLSDPFNFATPEFLRAYASFIELERRTTPDPENRHLLYRQVRQQETEKITF